ncbi:DUF262 domain-containing protein [Lentzea sp. CC55]|uniref:DUF262 domain-containing protein n=1 Tax=Lentzea sp. CC55 TaxID=2884909 RepID=UPI0027DF05C6|nr:DUF262 domain-containing protein [Lentzea sp. CC55]MCG8926869.1 DUF262 domain-containing HNH endonuclease family protein [Lentzea sp. CC55]
MVIARETTLKDLLNGSKQYRVPLYQRTYSWQEEQLSRLWDDVVRLAEIRVTQHAATHFIGSVVFAPSPGNGPIGVPQYLVVDGQQRLTTLTLLLCAIRDHRAAHEGPQHRHRINDLYLMNPHEPEQHRLRVVPTQTDRDSYLACVDSTPHAGASDPIGTAHRFFAARIAELTGPLDAERAEDAVTRGLVLVSITTRPGDNAHRIFESLNNTGAALTQADLLRNHLFMRLPTRGERVHRSLWLPLQSELEPGELDLLFWLDLVQRDPRVKQGDTYAGQQARLDRLRGEEDVEAEVARLCGLGRLLRRILSPDAEPDPAVRTRLQRLKDWGTTTVHPLLLHLLDRRQRGTATSDEIAAAMLHVESFLVRRLLIGRATANINRILLSAVTELDGTQPVDQAVRAHLSAGRKYFAGDDEVRAAVRAVPYYLNGRPHQRAAVLRWLEVGYRSKEPVELTSLTIEHVLPQTSTDAWEQAVSADLEPGESYEQVHDALVHTLGNLTLTGYNSELSNSPFDVKKAQLAKSGLVMNQHIAAQAEWGRPQILARADALAERVIALWPGPLDVTSAPPAAVNQGSLEQRFFVQVHDKQGEDVAAAVREVAERWCELGGSLELGTGRSETSCFLIAREKGEEGGNIWPFAIYPSGRVEVVFQHLRVRPPFDEVTMREELRQRLNGAPGVDIAAAKIELRPSFPLKVLLDPGARAVVLETLKWFYERARSTVFVGGAR